MHSLSVELKRFWSHCKDFITCHMSYAYIIKHIYFCLFLDCDRGSKMSKTTFFGGLIIT